MHSYYILGAAAIIALILIIVLATRKKPDYSSLEQQIKSFISDLESLKQHYISLSQLTQLQAGYRPAYSEAKSNRKKFSAFLSTYDNLPKLIFSV